MLHTHGTLNKIPYSKTLAINLTNQTQPNHTELQSESNNQEYCQNNTKSKRYVPKKPKLLNNL